VRDPERRIRRLRRGGFELSLPPAERELMTRLPAELDEMLGTDDPSMVRLFPPAHPDDPELETEYRSMVGDDLLARRREALQIVHETAGQRRLDADQVAAWLGALNDLRLVIGTQLEVTEEMDHVLEDDPRAPRFAVYGYLTWLQSQVVDALAEDLGS
jgi:hypothetical protein